jgi:hypothetical protein
MPFTHPLLELPVQHTQNCISAAALLALNIYIHNQNQLQCAAKAGW